MRSTATLLALASILFSAPCARAAEQTIALTPGFVFAALAAVPAEPLRSSALFAAHPTTIRQVFIFDEFSQTFKFQIRLETGGLFGPDLTLEPGRGFILKCSPGATGTLSVTGLPAGFAATAELADRFSFRGFPALAARPSSRTLLENHPALAAVFRWNPSAQSFDFALRLPGGDFFGPAFEMREGEGFFLSASAPAAVTFGRAVPLVPEFRVVDPTPTSATLLFFTEDPLVATGEYAAAGSDAFAPGRVIASGGRTHQIRFEGLSPNASYQARVALRVSESGPVASVEPATPLPFRTVAPPGVATPVSAYGIVVDGSGAPVAGAYAVVSYPDRSTAISGITNTIGVFLVTLTNLRDAVTGAELPPAEIGDEVETDVLMPGRSLIGQRSILGYNVKDTSTIFIGEFVLP